MKKVLIVGPDFFGYNESIASAFKNNNWNTEVVNYFDGRSMSFTQLISSTFKSNYYFDINKIKLNTNYELILVIKGTKLSIDKILELKKYCKKIYLWIMDPIKLYPEVSEKLSIFDKVFTFQKSDLSILSNQNINSIYLPLFYDDTIFRIETNKKKSIDLIFIGNLYEQRAYDLNLFCKTVIDSNENLSFHIYGGFGFLKLINYIKIKRKFKYLSKFLKFGLINPRKAAELYTTIKVGINIHVSSQTGLNMRFFELYGSGVIQILPNCNIELEEVDLNNESYICSELNVKEVMRIIEFSNNKKLDFHNVVHSSTNRIKEIINEYNHKN